MKIDPGALESLVLQLGELHVVHTVNHETAVYCPEHDSCWIASPETEEFLRERLHIGRKGDCDLVVALLALHDDHVRGDDFGEWEDCTHETWAPQARLWREQLEEKGVRL